MVLPVREVSASGYRSLQQIAYPVSDLDVFVGGNGVGKSNLYRSLELLRCAATNTLGMALAQEGLSRAFWAGPRSRSKPAVITLAVSLAAPDRRGAAYRYEVEVGFPPPGSAAFDLEPQVKTETLSYVSGPRATRIVERNGFSVTARNDAGRLEAVDIDLLGSETVLGRLEDPSRHPELDAVRRTLLEWRFYDDLRTDADSPMRRPSLAVATPTLASDGSNLAAVFATLSFIREDTVELDAAIDRAFPGARLDIRVVDSVASFGMVFPEFPKRVFEASELSGGTLRFLALLGALKSYRLPTFIALNEPESSLHSELIAPVAELVGRASGATQIWLVTHSNELAERVTDFGPAAVRRVAKRNGATMIEGLSRFGEFLDDDD